jgi:hypothetical protein
MNYREVERLSAYLDGQLGSSDLARLESQLQSDASLRAVLEDLRAARELLRKLPTRKAPSNFSLTRKMVGAKPPMPRAYPVYRLAAAFATILLLFTFAVNGIAPRLTSFASAAAPAYGYGGGGGGPESNPAATEAPVAVPPSELLPMPTAPVPAQDGARILETPSLKSSAPETLGARQVEARNKEPVPFGWQVGLGLIAIISGVITWVINRSTVARWRKQSK